MRAIRKIVIHCSDTYDDQECNAAIIDTWHKLKGWNSIGYHYVVLPSGIIEKGRDDEKIGAHVEGANSDSLGVVVIGGKTKGWQPTEYQYSALQNLIEALNKAYQTGDNKLFVLPHNHFTKKKTCPNFSVSDFLKKINY